MLSMEKIENPAAVASTQKVWEEIKKGSSLCLTTLLTMLKCKDSHRVCYELKKTMKLLNYSTTTTTTLLLISASFLGVLVGLKLVFVPLCNQTCLNKHNDLAHSIILFIES
ncbi:unnamed protein product [Sphagnum jensenii]|uniref:Uncharacterized protein n=1 Tax=Sphagnum jensenii TaxID=128206 RepID=A0ABP1B4P3_9BRYO